MKIPAYDDTEPYIFHVPPEKKKFDYDTEIKEMELHIKMERLVRKL
jgi:hypothetical protein